MKPIDKTAELRRAESVRRAGKPEKSLEILSRYHLDRVTATAESLKAFLRKEKVEGIVS